MLPTGSPTMDAERAFARAARARRREALVQALRRRPARDSALPVYDGCDLTGPAAMPGGVREIPLEAIGGTLEPGRARLFDRSFRPSRAARERWQRLWAAEQRGIVLPPISVTRVGDAYAVRDGHHRVSVARARGGVTIDATVDAIAA